MNRLSPGPSGRGGEGESGEATRKAFGPEAEWSLVSRSRRPFGAGGRGPPQGEARKGGATSTAEGGSGSPQVPEVIREMPSRLAGEEEPEKRLTRQSLL